MTRREHQIDAQQDLEGQSKSYSVGLLSAVRHHIVLILACILVAASSAAGFSLLQEKKYTASASLLFRDPALARDLFGSSALVPTGDPTRQAATNIRLVELEVVAERTAQALKNSPEAEAAKLRAGDISGMVATAAAGESDIVEVSATGPTPELAALVANTFSKQFISFRAEADRSKLEDAKGLADREYESLSASEKASPRGEALARAGQRLGIIASLQTGNAEFVQPAIPPLSPSSPRPLRNSVIGGLLGLFLGLGLAFALERMNRKLRSPGEVSELFEIPVLATIPYSASLEVGSQASEEAALPFEAQEAFLTLRSSLRYFNVDRAISTVLVTSALSGEGKTTIALGLAKAAASTSRTLLLETDLRRSSIASRTGMAVTPGMAEVLTHQTTIAEAVQPVALGAPTIGSPTEEQPTLDVLVGGRIPPNPTDLIE
ncbi:MAG: hypothetical protein KDA57_22225, partial [Planctomycetales bacterium]|nr:hypothetical protein [Planctomycetales bacterium]